MGRNVQESFITATPTIVCSTCGRSVKYYDRLDDGSLLCLSCSYEEGCEASLECVMHSSSFDPADRDLRIEASRISQIDVNRADKTICSVSIVIPEDLWKPIERLISLNNSSMNAEIVTALGWYTTACLNGGSSTSFNFLPEESVKSETDELAEILSADDPGVHHS